MNPDVFRRVEQKYLLTSEQYESLFREINDHIKQDSFFESTICNIYFDNENHDMIINSLEKPEFKEKLRLRSYGIPNMNSPVFLEIKDKYKGIVGKRRIKLKLKEYYEYLEKGIQQKNQIMEEIAYYFSFYQLKPFVFVAYDRKSYRGKNDENLRITVDSRLRYRYDNLKLEKESEGELYFDTESYIMEIKTLGAIPLWLARCLSKYKIYPTSFSKVGSIYTKSRRREVKC